MARPSVVLFVFVNPRIRSLHLTRTSDPCFRLFFFCLSFSFSFFFHSVWNGATNKTSSMVWNPSPMNQKNWSNPSSSSSTNRTAFLVDGFCLLLFLIFIEMCGCIQSSGTNGIGTSGMNQYWLTVERVKTKADRRFLDWLRQTTARGRRGASAPTAAPARRRCGVATATTTTCATPAASTAAPTAPTGRPSVRSSRSDRPPASALVSLFLLLLLLLLVLLFFLRFFFKMIRMFDPTMMRRRKHGLESFIKLCNRMEKVSELSVFKIRNRVWCWIVLWHRIERVTAFRWKNYKSESSYWTWVRSEYVISEYHWQ